MNPYEDRQRVRDRQYAAAWETLSPKERRRLAKAGISGPELPVYATGKRDHDLILERCIAPVVTEPDDVEPPVSVDAQTAVRRLVGELLSSDNTRLTIECLSLVTSIGYDGSSMTDIARKCGVTRAAVSKRCVEICEAMAIKPSRAMRKLTTRSVYEQRAKHCHSRSEH